MSGERVDQYLGTLDPGTLTIVDALRGIVKSAHDGLHEQIKWNAPSFSLNGEDRITLGVERKGGARMVLHRGAKAEEPADLRHLDPEKLARWAAPDRAILLFRTREDVAAKESALRDLCARWLAATC